MDIKISLHVLQTHEKLALVVLLFETGLGLQPMVSLIESVFPKSFEPELVKLFSGPAIDYQTGGHCLVGAALRASGSVEKAFYSLLSISYYLGVSTGEGARWFMKAGFEMIKSDRMTTLAAAIVEACKKDNPWAQINEILKAAAPSRQVEIIRDSLPFFHQTNGNIGKWAEYFASGGESFMKDKR